MLAQCTESTINGLNNTCILNRTLEQRLIEGCDLVPDVLILYSVCQFLIIEKSKYCWKTEKWQLLATKELSDSINSISRCRPAAPPPSLHCNSHHLRCSQWISSRIGGYDVQRNLNTPLNRLNLEYFGGFKELSIHRRLPSKIVYYKAGPLRALKKHVKINT